MTDNAKPLYELLGKRIRFCPVCGRDTVYRGNMNLQPIESENTVSGNAADFYCADCKASGIIDIDGRLFNTSEVTRTITRSHTNTRKEKP